MPISTEAQENLRQLPGRHLFGNGKLNVAETKSGEGLMRFYR